MPARGEQGRRAGGPGAGGLGLRLQTNSGARGPSCRPGPGPFQRPHSTSPRLSLQPLLQPEERKHGKVRTAHPHMGQEGAGPRRRGQGPAGGGQPPGPRPCPSVSLAPSLSLAFVRREGGPRGSRVGGRSSGVNSRASRFRPSP